jgi:hypothetical protein
METPQPPVRFTGIFVPRVVLDDPRLTPTDRILFGMLDGLNEPGRGCFGSNAYLANRLRIKERTLQDALEKLEALGYVTRGYVMSRRIIRTVSAVALEGVRQTAGGDAVNRVGGCGKPHPYIKGDSKEIKDNPPSPLKGGKRVRRRALKVNPEDYSRGF